MTSVRLLADKSCDVILAFPPIFLAWRPFVRPEEIRDHWESRTVSMKDETEAICRNTIDGHRGAGAATMMNMPT